MILGGNIENTDFAITLVVISIFMSPTITMT